MDVKAIAKRVRISPIKIRLVVDMVRGKNADEALVILSNYNTKAARVVKKVLDSAVANAVNNNKLDKTKLENEFYRLPSWQDATDRYCKQLTKSKKWWLENLK